MIYGRPSRDKKTPRTQVAADSGDEGKGLIYLCNHNFVLSTSTFEVDM